MRTTLRLAQREGVASFPILLNAVVYDGVHAYDHISVDRVTGLLNEVEIAKCITFEDPEDRDYFEDFLGKMSRLCKASLATQHPIIF